MKANAVLGLCTLLLALIPATLEAAGIRGTGPLERPETQFAIYNQNTVQHGGSYGFSKAPPDTFNIYGGVLSDGTNDRRPEGQFQTLGWAPQPQGWFGVDRTENPVHWNVSTFNAANLDPLPGNHAMWCGVDGTTPGYVSAPGYGNNWNDVLDWTGLTNPTINTLVRLVFDYNHDSEPAYDFFRVEADSGGTWVPLLVIDGDNRDGNNQFTTPAHFDETLLFTPLMYTGTPPYNVRLRLRFTSDGAWSDEDGLWPTSGAAQADNIQVLFGGVPVTQYGDGTATFESPGGILDDEGWTPRAADFAGDFSRILPQLRDIDPCRINLTPQVGFMDDGTPPNNAPGVSTGGSLSPTWSYGIPGGWVVNYNGGLTNGAVPLYNEAWSPEIAWDDPTTTDDDVLDGGAFMRFTVWQHLPLENGMFWIWSIRSRTAGGAWSTWRNRNFVYYGDRGGTYTINQVELSDLLVAYPEAVQIALGVIDLAETFDLPGTDATPSPTFDNVSLWRYGLPGPTFFSRNIDLFNDGFATSGAWNYDADPSLMSVRVDMARDVNSGSTFNVPGDSIVVDVVPVVPGTSLSGSPLMKWILEANPLFDGVRSIPAGATALSPSSQGWDRWFGTVVGDSARTANGFAVQDRFFFDLPHDGPANLNAPYQSNEPAMVFPGDRVRYFLEATDTGANTTTMPPDTSGFMSGDDYSRVQTIRALPTLRQDGPDLSQPGLLVINDFGHRGGEDALLHAFGQIGMVEEQDYEVYTVQGPSSLVSNGIGSAGAHGATGAQLGGYGSILYVCGDLSDGLLSDGSGTGANDKGDDISTLTAWHDLAGDRSIAYFGDNLASFLGRSGAPGLTYLSTVLGVDAVDNDVRDELAGMASPIVEPNPAMSSIFTQDYVAWGGCLYINTFDSILPLPPAVVSHHFTDGTQIFAPAAGVWYERTQLIDSVSYNRVDATFPYGLIYVIDRNQGKGPGGISSRSLLLRELIEGFGQATGGSAPVAADPVTPGRLEVQANHPNPFNPATAIRFTAPSRGRVSVEIYTLRGERVASLLDEVVDSGPHRVVWRGIDDRERPVSSGVYFYQVRGFGRTVTRKMALVR